MIGTTMTPASQFLLLLSCCLFNGWLGTGFGGPAFINPSVAAASVQPPTSQASFVTQTVYGFLDFTTTIGNTVMVFSPQSASADNENDKVAKPAITTVIDTTPVISVQTQQPITIKPSKTQTENKNNMSEAPKFPKVSTIINVQSNAIVSSKVEVKPKPSIKVNVIENSKSIVNVVTAKSSKPNVIVTPVSKVIQENIITKVEVVTGISKVEKPPIVSTKVEVQSASSTNSPLGSSIVSSVVEIHSQEEPAVVIGNNIGEPEYDFLSRQPSEVVEETYKLINLKPSSKFHLKHRSTSDVKLRQLGPAHRVDTSHPTGLVTKLGGTIVKDGITTVHETSVIGTYISGKYAQVLQSTSHIHHNHPKPKINPSPTLRILKTAAPVLGKVSKHHHLEPTPTSSNVEETVLENLPQNHIRATRKSTVPINSFKQRFKSRPREQDVEEDNEAKEPTTPASVKKNKSKLRPTQSPRPQNNDPPPPATTSASTRKYPSRKSKPKASSPSTETTTGFSRRGYKQRSPIQATTTEQVSAVSTSVYKFKLNRTPGRWQYKTSPKPRVSIIKQNKEDGGNSTIGPTQNSIDTDTHINDIVTPQARSDDLEGLVGSESVATVFDNDSSTENKIDNALPPETLKVEISTPSDFKDTYYEIATIKTPYTYQVNGVKKSRYITVTSTFEKVIESSAADGNINSTKVEPLTENILVTSTNFGKDNNFLDSSIATLPPLYMAADMETPPLETMTEMFSTTQTMLKTHILPAVRGGNETSSYTLVQTYLITRIVTATKTLPPMEAYHFVPSKILNEFNSHLDEAGSELNLELAFGDENENEADSQLRRSLPGDLDLAKIGSDFDLSEIDKSNLPVEVHLRSKKAHAPTTPRPPPNELILSPNFSPEQLQQLALLRLLNPAVGQGQVITTSKPVIKIETVYESHVIPLFNGHNTILTTISKALGTITKTDYEFGTSTLPPALPNLQIPPINPLFQQPQPQYAVTTSPFLQSTIVTETQSKILKLTFGARTTQTTIFSTKLVPTLVTTYLTASVPIQPTAAFPGFFPAPYPAFPYVG